MKTLADLWNGTLKPACRLGETNREIKHLEQLLQRNSKQLTALFNANQAERWEVLSDCMDEYLSLLCEQAFCDGFCLGAKITAESLGDTDSKGSPCQGSCHGFAVTEG